MSLERPDLSTATPEILAYIEALEAQLAEFSERDRAAEEDARSEPPLEPSEPPTTINIITISSQGMAKRTPRHLYFRQRRGGMGIFDLDSGEADPPAFLLAADESAGLICVTDQARAFRLGVSDLAEAPVRSRGRSLRDFFNWRNDERLALVFVDQGGAYLALVTERGQIRRIGSQYLGKNLQAGTVLYNIKEGGAPAAACWTAGNDELVIATQTGQGIRFAERLVPLRGCLGMRVDPTDRVVGVAASDPTGGIFLVSADGKGTIRLLSGFAANKSPGAGGKTLLKCDALVGVAPASDQHDLFVISRLGKVIRFAAAEIPPKEGVVQGVNCMALRADDCVAMTSSLVSSTPAP